MIVPRLIGLDRFDRFMRDLHRELPRATAQGINRTADQTRTLASKVIREQVALKKKAVDERFFIRRATADNTVAELRTARRGLLLSRFPTRPAAAVGARPVKSRAGVAVRVKTRGSLKTIPGAFFMRLLYGSALGDTVGVAVRRPGQRKAKVLHGPSVSQVFNTVREDIAPDVRDLARKNLDHSLSRALEAIR